MKGLTHTQAAHKLGVLQTTVAKYATQDYSPVLFPSKGHGKLAAGSDKYARKTDKRFETDRRMPRKQRHTI